MAKEETFVGQTGATWRYWPDQPLGSPGGFGRVYAGEAADGTPMAVKVVGKSHAAGVLADVPLHREGQIGRPVVDGGGGPLPPARDLSQTHQTPPLFMHKPHTTLP